MRSGEVIAYPTETLYGLGADPRNPKALEKLFSLKPRDQKMGITLIADESFSPPGSLAKDLAKKHWPGPLTMVMELEEQFADGIAAPDGSVAVRVSTSELARGLAKAAGGFITATSVNPHGQPPAKAAHCLLYTSPSPRDATLSRMPSSA